MRSVLLKFLPHDTAFVIVPLEHFFWNEVFTPLDIPKILDGLVHLLPFFFFFVFGVDGWERLSSTAFPSCRSVGTRFLILRGRVFPSAPALGLFRHFGFRHL